MSGIPTTTRTVFNSMEEGGELLVNTGRSHQTIIPQLRQNLLLSSLVSPQVSQDFFILLSSTTATGTTGVISRFLPFLASLLTWLSNDLGTSFHVVSESKMNICSEGGVTGDTSKLAVFISPTVKEDGYGCVVFKCL